VSLRESCGVFGVNAGEGEAFPYLYWGMLAQNHRGHQSHGFATLNDGIECHTDLWLIPPITEAGIRSRVKVLRGHVGIGNVRYATSGPSDVDSLQRDAMPILVSEGGIQLAVSFNGNVVNVRNLQDRVGAPRSCSDTHALALLILKGLRETGSIEEAARACMESVDGAFSVAGLTGDGTLFAFKDPMGIRPLCYGCRGGVQAFSSESVGLDINGIEFDHELEPGEVVKVEDGEASMEGVAPCGRRAFCAFEFAYFARPDSLFNGKYVYEARKSFGASLARIYQDIADGCDVVISLPETANDAAYGFHEESGLPWEMATRRHRYVTQRAFITGEEERRNVVLRKVNILGRKVRGRRLAVVDDSIVRGDTTRGNVARFREAGAEEIHLFITYPRITGPCFYGVNMATYGELIGARLDPEGVAREVGADSVSYLPVEEYVRCTGMGRDRLCLGCVTGEYPTPRARELAREMRERLARGLGEEGRIYERA